MSNPNSDDPQNTASMIDENLKKVYDDLASEELPDRFKELLSSLKSGERDHGNAK